MHLRNDMNIEKTLFWYISALTILSLIAWQIIFIRGQFLGMSFPYNTFLFDQSQQFSDFTMFDSQFFSWIEGGLIKATPKPLAWLGADSDLIKEHPPLIYSPVATYVILFYYLIYPLSPVYAYLLSLWVSICIASVVLGYSLRYSTEAKTLWIVIFVTMLASYPFMLVFDRANIEGLPWIFLLLGTISFVRNRYLTAGILFAVAASFKYFPGIFLLLLISRKKYMEFVVSMIFLVWISLFSAYELGGNILETYSTFLNGIAAYKEIAILARITPQYDHSLFGLIKQILFILGLELRNISGLHNLYAFSAITTFVMLYIFKIRKLPILNQVFALSISGIILPFVSFDYTLIHLYIPWGLFMIFLAYDAKLIGFSTRQSLQILIPLAILFTPQTYLISDTIGGFGGQMKAIALLYLLMIVLKNPMFSPTLFREDR